MLQSLSQAKVYWLEFDKLILSNGKSYTSTMGDYQFKILHPQGSNKYTCVLHQYIDGSLELLEKHEAVSLTDAVDWFYEKPLDYATYIDNLNLKATTTPDALPIEDIKKKAKTLRVFTPVRFPEDNVVNGNPDCNDSPKLPLLTTKLVKVIYSEASESYSLTLDIDIETGKVANWQSGVYAELNIKTCDSGIYSILDKDHDILYTLKNSYVPRGLDIDAEGYGDYIYLTINGEGYIKGWSKELIEHFYNKIS